MNVETSQHWEPSNKYISCQCRLCNTATLLRNILVPDGRSIRCSPDAEPAHDSVSSVPPWVSMQSRPWLKPRCRSRSYYRRVCYCGNLREGTRAGRSPRRLRPLGSIDQSSAACICALFPCTICTKLPTSDGMQVHKQCLIFLN